MSGRGPWIEIGVAGVAIACALALGLATLGAAAGITVGAYGETPAPQTSTSQVSIAQTSNREPSTAQTPALRPAILQEATERTYEGMVTCSRCGARHPA